MMGRKAINILLKERIDLGLRYSRTTRSRSNDRHIMLRRWIARETIAVLDGSLLARTYQFPDEYWIKAL